LAVNGFEYESLEDIKDNPGVANIMAIYTHDPCMRIKFAHSWAELYAADTGEPESQQRATLQKVADCIAATERPRLWYFSKLSAWLAPLLAFGALSAVPLMVALQYVDYRFGVILMLGLAIPTIVWWIGGRHLATRRFCRIDFSQ
jgi:hypothetical protein